MTEKIKSFFNELIPFLNDVIAPISNELDNNPQLLADCYLKLVNMGALRLLIPSALGGLGGERTEWINYNIQMSEYSGVLLFLQAQHQYSIAKLKRLLPDPHIEAVFQSIVRDDTGLAIAVAANRNIIQTKKLENGFSVSGTLFWVTGLNYFPNILLSFDYNSTDYYTLLDFKPVGTSVTFSPKIEPIVFSAANTVSITLKDHFIPSKAIFTTRPSNHNKVYEHPTVYNFVGASKALLKIAANEKYSNNPNVKNKLNYLFDETNIYYDEIIKNESDPLTLRANGLKLAEKCLLFAKMVCGSKGLLSSHPINRLSREIWQYSVAGYSEGQLEAYLEKTF